VEQSVEKDDPDPKAISCYGLYVPEFEEVWPRFVDGRPVSGITTRFLSWCSEKLEALGKKVWVLISGTTRAGTSPKRLESGSPLTFGHLSAAFVRPRRQQPRSLF
jgi:hypothetical protein